MSQTNTTQYIVILLNDIAISLNHCVSILIYIFGTIGNLLNVFVLVQPPLCSNPLAMFLLLSSIAGLLVIISGLTGQRVSSYATDLTFTIGWTCKLRSFILYGSRTMVLWLIILASIDRWLSSSATVNFRNIITMWNV
ncbi:unnamed protein product [Rotaria magnacalcarata]|uniref:G-protein coupled receptors family 1 profile domain-containing protein n=1 Tax=Rotaria magnacalcarata TaxID=392030 RepID=A0A815JVQ1_9BILA|nr:unnamed protein product [Rotaria magnacalcarata]CAF2091024.1 unnamed protein product [Rotaria magnacalcarata]CAF4167019.1 unnamed protein product [Rotaria magnacalcarata]CAF4919703.1 unnamed protein product [Rotaria magnacalcarata]